MPGSGAGGDGGTHALLVELVRSRLAYKAATAGHGRVETEAAFAAVDPEGSGFVSYGAFKQAIGLLDLALPDYRVAELLTIWDPTGQGFVRYRPVLSRLHGPTGPVATASSANGERDGSPPHSSALRAGSRVAEQWATPASARADNGPAVGPAASTEANGRPNGRDSSRRRPPEPDTPHPAAAAAAAEATPGSGPGGPGGTGGLGSAEAFRVDTARAAAALAGEGGGASTKLLLSMVERETSSRRALEATVGKMRRELYRQKRQIETMDFDRQQYEIDRWAEQHSPRRDDDFSPHSRLGGAEASWPEGGDESPPPFRPAGVRPAGALRPARRVTSPAVFGGGMLGRLQ